MTRPQNEPWELGALDELGRRFDVAVAHRRSYLARPRRALVTTAVGLVALVGTPAIASISGAFDFPPFNSHSSIEETLPWAAAVIDPDDPGATGRALDRLGFDVRWSLVEDDPKGATPTRSHDVSRPPAGTEILSVLRADGSSKVSDATRSLLIEVAPADSKILQEHR